MGYVVPTSEALSYYLYFLFCWSTHCYCFSSAMFFNLKYSRLKKYRGG